MSTIPSSVPSKEKTLRPVNGGLLLTLTIILYLAIVGSFVWVAVQTDSFYLSHLVLLILATIALPFVLAGLFVVPPREARVLVLFGKYAGTVRDPGFFWANPFAKRTDVSLKAVNIASERIKVNDLDGNPIEIGAVVVYQVRDTSQAVFDVEDYRQFTDIQVETAVRKLASIHPYADDSDDVVSLRGDSEEVSNELLTELQDRLDRAGIEVIEARLSHLAYAAEIASAMLQRQQAAAIVAARRQIVDGAVGMVEDAIHSLADKDIIELDPERKATLVGNLLVVLCGQADAQPVINTGTMYN
ncbi:MAG TPA: SPFH domain-containing protein [Candidatus Krumholzibacteria bacterium]|nr:SPFH domain-containing protein [Candidatus Krumholzibacteria bacterium]